MQTLHERPRTETDVEFLKYQIESRMRRLEQVECVCELFICPSCIAITALRRELHELGTAA